MRSALRTVEVLAVMQQNGDIQLSEELKRRTGDHEMAGSHGTPAPGLYLDGT